MSPLEVPMSQRERVREELTEPITPERLAQRARDGWHAVAIEWERSAGAAITRRRVELPYGLRIADDCHHLEDDPAEIEVLTQMLHLIVEDRKLSDVAAELNRRGYRNRTGGGWTQSQVFELLPRLTESAPQIFARQDWGQERKRRGLRAV
jgi:hypothetical protein